MNKSWGRGIFLAGLFYKAVAQASVIPLDNSVIFLKGENEKRLSVVNYEQDAPVLLQAWVDGGQPGSLAHSQNYPFVITPAIIKLKPMQVVNLRIFPTEKIHSLPTDRESIYWLNLFEVPGLVKGSRELNASEKMRVGLNSQLKIVYRPFNDQPNAASLTKKLAVNVCQEKEGNWAVDVVNNSHFVLVPVAITAHQDKMTHKIKLSFDRDILPYSSKRFSIGKTDIVQGSTITLTLNDDTQNSYDVTLPVQRSCNAP